MPATARVHGPYPNGSNFRVVVVENGVRKSVCVATREEGERLKADLLRSISECDVAVAAALTEYLEEKQRHGCKPLSLYTLESKLRLFLPQDQGLKAVTPARAQKLYDDETTRTGRFGRVVSPTTHRLTLRLVKAFFRWTVKRGYLRANPFEGVQPVGKPNAGKRQLTLNEARRLCQWLLERTESGDEGALALLLQLLLGLRSGEVLSRVVRDVDDDGRVLAIPFGKTGNARRRLHVPEEIRPLLLRQVQGQPPEHLIFGGSQRRPRYHTYLSKRLHKACETLGLPRVCPHSLRGLHSTLALEAGATSTAVASALGHGSFEVTARHYAHPDTLRNTSVRRVAAALRPARPLDASEVEEALRALSPEEQARILASLAVRR